MNIFVAGGGRVGFHLARIMCSDQQNVTVIENSVDRVEQIDYALDVSTSIGDGSNVMLLQNLGVANADLFVASMGNDEKNLIAAATAKGLGAKKVVARVDNPMYIDSNILYETILGVDYILSPDALAALEIANFIINCGVISKEKFSHGLVEMREIRVVQSPTVLGKKLKDVIPPGSGVLVGLIERDSRPIIPHGDAIIEPGDHVALIGHKEKIDQYQQMFMGAVQKPKRVFVMGGGTIGLRLAQALEDEIKSVKVFEKKEAHAEKIAGLLNSAKVVCRDASTRTALEQEHVEGVDFFVAATDDDERNIMAGVLAKEVGAKSVISIVHQPDFAPLVRRLGIDLAVTPRACVASRVLKLIHQGQVTSLAVLGEGSVEIIEMKVADDSPLLGKKLKEITAKFPRGALIANIIRGDKAIVPGGEDMILAGDSVIIIAEATALDAVRRLLQRK